MQSIPTTYKDAGVDILAGDDASTIMLEASKQTWRNQSGLVGEIEMPGGFLSAVRMVQASRFADAVVGMNLDGVGTKIELAERMDCHTTVAHDLLAMVCDDAAAYGAEPVLVGNILDCSNISLPVIRQLALGLIEAAKLAHVAVINGEIAELGERVGGFGPAAYNWGAVVFWIGRRERLLTGNKLKPGDAIVAVHEPGLRSNGLSLIRNVFTKSYGVDWHLQPFQESTLGEAALRPSVIYTHLMLQLTGGYSGNPRADAKGFCHITGGGIPGKLGRLLSETGLGARLDSLFEPCDLMVHCQELANVDDEEAYRTWNMGQGLLIVTQQPEEVTRHAKSLGFTARIAGQIQQDPVVQIRNQGFYRSRNTWLSYPVERRRSPQVCSTHKS